MIHELRRSSAVRWVAGQRGARRPIGPLRRIDRFPEGWRVATRTGELWICDTATLRSWQTSAPSRRADWLRCLFGTDTRAVILARTPIPSRWHCLAQHRAIPLLATPLPPAGAVRRLTGALPETPDTERALVPGTLVIVAGRGILLSGPSGSGKSDLALTLLDRGHQLLADDAVFLFRSGAVLTALADPDWVGALAVRGLGMLDVRRFWNNAVCAEHSLDLTVELSPPSVSEWPSVAHAPCWDTMRLQEVAIPRLRLPTAPGRPLAVLVETAARSLATGGEARFGQHRDLPWN